MEISLEYFPATTGITEYCAKYSRDSEDAITTNSDQYEIESTFNYTGAIGIPIKQSN